MTSYYANKVELLRDIFGAASVHVEPSVIVVDGKRHPVVDDVIVLTRPEAPDLPAGHPPEDDQKDGIRRSFGDEWQAFPEILSEHEEEFRQYFDLLDLGELAGKRVCDLGCGIGRWSYFLRDRVSELVLVDFSDSIFVAREHLRECDRAVFLMGDLQSLPFREGFADLIVCLGVLHHMPNDALAEVRRLKRYAPDLLIYLYSALDKRPPIYRILLRLVTEIRLLVHPVRSRAFRSAFTWAATMSLYLPLIWLGTLLRPFGLSNAVPLYDFYHGKTVRRIKQDVYDRFFAEIEQRFSHKQISQLSDTFSRVTISPQIPYWHFRCER